MVHSLTVHGERKNKQSGILSRDFSSLYRMSSLALYFSKKQTKTSALLGASVSQTKAQIECYVLIDYSRPLALKK